MPEIRSISAVTFTTRDMARAVRFYAALGLTMLYGGGTSALNAASSVSALVNSRSVTGGGGTGEGASCRSTGVLPLVAGGTFAIRSFTDVQVREARCKSASALTEIHSLRTEKRSSGS